MAISRDTLRLARQLRITVGTEADTVTRNLTRAWLRAWDGIAAALIQAIDDATEYALRHGRWPPAWELSRIRRLSTALRQAEDALATLGKRAAVDVTDAAGHAIEATVNAEPRLIASQLPAAEQATAAQRFAAQVLPSALDTIVARTTGQITSTLRPLSADAYEAMQRELVRGVAAGVNPRDAAARMVARVRGAFDGGLTRATVIARTEILDAYRAASRYTHAANADVLAGWRWQAQLDSRVCVSCVAMSGSVHPVTEPGPQDHAQGRCARLPVTKSWRELGIALDEPPSTIIPDARAWFSRLPEADQTRIMGAGRLQLLRSGHIGWDDLAVRRSVTGWRDSYHPASLRDLHALANTRRAQYGLAPLAPLRPVTRAGLPARAEPVAKPATKPAAPQSIAERVAAGVRDRQTLTGGQNAKTELLTLNDGTKVVFKIARDVEGVPARILMDAEELGAKMHQAFGIRAPEVYRKSARQMYMEYLDGKVASRLDRVPGLFKVAGDYYDSDDGRIIGLVDMLIENYDRNTGNWLVGTDGRLQVIDHGFAFVSMKDPSKAPIWEDQYFWEHFHKPYPRLSEWADNDLSPQDVTTARRRVESLRPEFERLGHLDWYDNALARLQWVGRHARGTKVRLR